MLFAADLFNNREQHDAHEFLNYLVNTVDDLLRKPAKGAVGVEGEGLPPATRPPSPADAPEPCVAQPKRTWVDDVFKGTLTNETKCLCCETVSHVTVTRLSVLCGAASLLSGRSGQETRTLLTFQWTLSRMRPSLAASSGCGCEHVQCWWCYRPSLHLQRVFLLGAPLQREQVLLRGVLQQAGGHQEVGAPRRSLQHV